MALKKTVFLCVVAEINPYLEEHLKEIFKEALETDGVIKIIEVKPGDLMITTDLPRVYLKADVEKKLR